MYGRLESFIHFSLRYQDEFGDEQVLITIEVDHKQQRIEQAKGKYNRKIDANQMKLLKSWAKVNELQIAKYL